MTCNALGQTTYLSYIAALSIGVLIVWISLLNPMSAVAATADVPAINDYLSHLPPAIRQKSTNYQVCVNKIMSSLEPANSKRQLIARRCKTARDDLIAAFPGPVQRLMAINTDRRIEGVLDALEQVEGLINESTVDIYGISVQLQLSPPTSGQ